MFLLLDHQAGLFQTVKDISVADPRSNVVMLAKLATHGKIEQIGTKLEIMQTPATTFVADFIQEAEMTEMPVPVRRKRRFFWWGR